jgi:hypothetical protein
VWSCSAEDGHYPLTARGAIRPTAGGQWRPAVDISATEGGSPDVALGPDGRAVAIWEEDGPFTTPAPPAGIYASVYDAGLNAPGVPQSGCPARPPATASAPVLSHVRMTHTHFRAGQTPTAAIAKTAPGTAFLFDLSTTAEINVAFTSLRAGLRRGHLCVPPSRALRRAGAKTCQRTVQIAKLTRHSLQAGGDRIRFTGRIGRRALGPGSYTARIMATNAVGSSPPSAVRFKITR